VAEKRATSRREWAIAVIGGLALSMALVAFMRPDMFSSAAEPAPSVTIASAPQPLAITAPQLSPPASPAAIATEGLLLRGVLLPGGAIFEDGSGGQRLVRLGQPLRPDTVVLASLTRNSATLRSADGSLQTLMLDGTAPPLQPTTAPAVAAGAALMATPASLRASSNDYRLALQPLRGPDGGDVRGWQVRDPADVPLFKLAGLQPGDVLISINDQPLFSQEKIMELPGEIAGAYAVKLEYSRSGRKAAVTVQLTR
jgi:general secretion pathway protein C